MGERSSTPSRLLRKRQQIMNELIAGTSYAQAAYTYKTAKRTLQDIMREYRPYRAWTEVRRKNRLLLEDEVRQYLMSGKPVVFCAELYDMSYEDMRQFVHGMELRDGKQYLGIADSRNVKKYITVQDVAEFKKIVQVGETLICDETEDGIVVCCTILKKHLWYADTDMGTIDWNWLCVKNERRLFSDEIIYG